VIGGVEVSGLAQELLEVAGAANLHRPAVLTVVTAALSNLVSNVPAVLLFKPVIPTFGERADGSSWPWPPRSPGTSPSSGRSRT